MTQPFSKGSKIHQNSIASIFTEVENIDCNTDATGWRNLRSVLIKITRTVNSNKEQERIVC